MLQTIDVNGEAADLVENTSTFHTDVDRSLSTRSARESVLFSQLPGHVSRLPESPPIRMGSSMVMGDHAENSFSVDGQPITDQQSKVFSESDPTRFDPIARGHLRAHRPAEFGEKTSVVINVTTRSGLGMTTPTGGVTASYGSFGTSNFGC